MKSILIVEDDLTFSTMLKTWLGKRGFVVDTVSNNARARKILHQQDFDLVLSDLRLPDEDGLYLLSWLRNMGNNTPFIIMTSYAEVQNAVDAMKQGASDYIAKPVQPDILLKKIDMVITAPLPSVETKNESANGEAEHDNYTNNFLEGESEAARMLYNYVRLVAPTPMSVLINGASGTGKEYVAHRIHQLSKRSDKPFVAIDCGAMLKELAASEFFGHVKGSFTGAVTDKTGAFVEANGGTLFLDEVGNLSYDVQVQLLRAIQEHRIRPVGSTQEIAVDVRLVCATNENLEQAIQNGLFREDLYHRINEFTLKMPALKDRQEDILLFANFFLDQANRELDKDLIGFDMNAERVLQTYSWPGNLRQMKNVIKRATLLAKGDFITREDLGDQLTELRPVAVQNTFALHDAVSEKERILHALQATNNNKSKAAQLLGIDRKTLYNKLKLYQIS